MANEKLWNDFYTNTKNKKECSITILQYTAQNDPILTYLSYKENGEMVASVTVDALTGEWVKDIFNYNK